MVQGPGQALVSRLAGLGWSAPSELHRYSGAFRTVIPWSASTTHALEAKLKASLFQIRSVYRCIELSQGFEGHLATIEACFYGLDTLPLFIAVSVYVPFWPGRFIPRNAALVEERPDSTDTVETEEKMTP